MAKRKRIRHMTDEEIDREDTFENVLAEIEGVAEESVKVLKEELSMNQKQAYRKVKELLKQVAKYGF